MKTKVLLLCTVMAASGCSMQAQWPEPEQQAHLATGIENAIELRIDPGHVNVDQAVTDNHLSLTQAVHDALYHSPEIQMALWRVRAAQAQTHQARLLPNPVLSVMVRWSQGAGTPMVEAGLAADLLSLLNKPGEIDLADNELRTASAQSVVVVLDELAKVQTAYATVQSQDAILVVLDERLRLYKQLVELSHSRLEAGEGKRVDVTTLDSQRVELEVEIAQQRLLHRENRLNLARLIGSPQSEAQWTTDPWSPELFLKTSQSVTSETRWLEAALKHRPEMQAVVSQLAALGAHVKLTNLLWIQSGNQGVSSERESGGDWSIGPAIAVPLPLFDWGQAKRKKAKAMRTEATYQLQSTTRQVIEEVRRAYVAWHASKLMLAQVRDELLPLLDRREEETSAAYRAGQLDVQAVILAENDLQSAQAQLINLKRQTAEALIRLQRAAGGPGHVPTAEDETSAGDQPPADSTSSTNTSNDAVE